MKDANRCNYHQLEEEDHLLGKNNKGAPTLKKKIRKSVPFLLKDHPNDAVNLKENASGKKKKLSREGDAGRIGRATEIPMWGRVRILRYRVLSLPIASSSSLIIMDNYHKTSSFSTFAHSTSTTSGGRGRGRGRGSGLDMKHNRASSGKDKIDALGRLLTRILRHMASELNLNVRSDGYAKVQDLLKLNMKTFANVPLRSHTVDDIREAVRKDNKQRFSLLEENGELLIRANQGHTITTIETEQLLKPILSAEEVPVCVHGTYKKNLDSILECGLKRMQRVHVHFSCGLPTDGEVVSGMRRNVNVLIFLDVRKALEEGMKLYISDNKVILTEGFDGIVPVKYFEKIESWPDRQPIPF